MNGTRCSPWPPCERSRCPASPDKSCSVRAAPTAAKLEIYRAMRDAGLGEEQLAVRLGWQPAQVTRLFDGRRPIRLDHVEAALRALGRPLVVTSEAA
jgi:hypothetical protein